MSETQYWKTELAEAADNRQEQPSFHVFAEGMHSDVRGQIFNLTAGDEFPLWTTQWPHHLFIVLVISGELEATMDAELVHLRHLSQLVVLPGTSCKLNAQSDSAIEVISLLSQPPAVDVSAHNAI